MKTHFLLSFLLATVPSWGQQAVHPTLKDVSYGDHKAQAVDVYLPKSDKPTPVMIQIHGGGWRAGSKKRVPSFLKRAVAEGWLAVVSVEYRFTDVAVHPAQTNDCLLSPRWNSGKQEGKEELRFQEERSRYCLTSWMVRVFKTFAGVSQPLRAAWTPAN